MDYEKATEQIVRIWAGARSGLRFPPETWLDVYLTIPADKVGALEALHLALMQRPEQMRRIIGCSRDYYDGMLLTLNWAISHAQIIPAVGYTDKLQ